MAAKSSVLSFVIVYLPDARMKQLDRLLSLSIVLLLIRRVIVSFLKKYSL